MENFGQSKAETSLRPANDGLKINYNSAQNLKGEFMKKKSARLRATIISLVFAASLVTPFTMKQTVAAKPKADKAAITIVTPDDPEAIFETARIVHNVTVNGKKGMRVHAKFHVKYGMDVACMMIAYFYFDDADNTPLKTSDQKYRAKDGTVSATANFTPAYDPAVYNDLQIFMPYDALNMESGDDYDLKFYLALYDKEGGRFFGKSGWYKFHLTMP